MSDSDKKLNIEIAVNKTGDGDKQAAHDLQNLTDASKETRKATDELTDATHESAEGAEHSEESHHALHGILRLLGRETVPELGEALHAATLGSLGGLLAIGFAAEFVKEKLARANEEAEKFANIQWDARLDSLNKFTASSNELADALVKAGKAADPIRDKFESALKVLEKQIEAHQKILEEMEKEDLAAAGKDEQAKEQIRARYDNAKQRLDSRSDQDKIALEQKQLAERQHDQPGLEEEARRRAALVAAAGNDPEYLRAKSDADLGDAQKQKVREARALVTHEGGAEAVRNMEKPDADTGELGSNSETERYTAAQAALKLTEEYDKNLAVMAAHDEAVKHLTGLYDDAARRAEQNKSAITDGQKNVKTDQSVFNQKTAGDELDKGISFARTAASGGQLTKGQEEYERTIATLIAGQNVTKQQAQQMLLTAANNHSVLDSFLQRLFAAVEKMPGTFSVYQDRLYRIERSISQLQSQAASREGYRGQNQ